MYYCIEIEYVTIIPYLHSEGRCILEILQYWVLYNHHYGSRAEPNIFFHKHLYIANVLIIRSPIKIKTMEIYQLMSFTMQLKLSPTPNTQWGPGTRTPPHWDIKTVEFLVVSNKLWWSAPLQQLQQLQQLQPTSNLMTRMQNMRLQNKFKVGAAFICLPISASPMHPNIFGKTANININT